MESNVSEEKFQCSNCDQFLNLTSETLPCLHSLCRSCLEGHIKGAAFDNCKCPQCHEPVVARDQLRLAPFLVKSLRRRHLESSEWRCDWCFEDNVESVGQIWCQDCQKLFCQNCERFHKRFHPDHETKDLLGMARGEAIKIITMDKCRLHRKSKDTFCERCNVCLCDICYEDHVTASLQCPPLPLSVRKEALNMKMRGPTLEQELLDFENRIHAINEQTRQSIDQLSTDCNSECSKLRQNFEAFIEVARLKLEELCNNVKETTSEQVRKWRLSLNEKNKLLKKVQIWRHNLQHLLRDGTEDEDVVCGLRLVQAEFSLRFHESFAPVEKGHLVVEFPNWCHDSLDSLNKELIDFTVKTPGNLEIEREYRLTGSNLNIYSILANDKDNNIFLCDWNGKSIEIIGESGEFVGQCLLTDGGEGFCPWDICRLSEDILVVCCPWGTGRRGGRLFFLAQNSYQPFLEKKNIIDTKEKQFYSLCQIEKNIFACDRNFQEIVCFSENGEAIKAIQIGGLPGSGPYSPLLRADPTTGNLWGTKRGMSEIFVFNQNGQILHTVKIGEEICDFCANEFGHFYFCTKEGIFSVLSKKKLYKFPKKSENNPKIFVSSKNVFVCFKNDGKDLLKIFKIN